MSDTSGNGTNGRHGEQWPSAGVGAPTTTDARPEPAPKRLAGALGFSLSTLRRRRPVRILLWTVVVGLALGGIGLLAYPFATNIWADRIQGDLEQEFAAETPAKIKAYEAKSFKTGDAVTRIRIPSLSVDKVVVEGITGNALRAGVGHYPTSALPGDSTGNVAIAGHRTGFGSPFRNLERLKEGDVIWLETPVGRYKYEVAAPFDGHGNPWITTAHDWSVVTQTPEPSLTLTSCDPPGTSKNRLIVRAVLTQSLPAA